MKQGRMNESFLEHLKKRVRELKDMRPGEVHVLSVNANYGHYQIVIGPEVREGTGQNGETRRIEINGEVHHLFVSPHTVQPHPSRNELLGNLKHTVIMRDLTIHLCDPKGDGRHLTKPSNGNNGLQARECINMAGNKGSKLIEKALHSKQVPMAAYRIIQKDILHALSEKRK